MALLRTVLNFLGMVGGGDDNAAGDHSFDEIVRFREEWIALINKNDVLEISIVSNDEYQRVRESEGPLEAGLPLVWGRCGRYGYVGPEDDRYGPLLVSPNVLDGTDPDSSTIRCLFGAVNDHHHIIIQDTPSLHFSPDHLASFYVKKLLDLIGGKMHMLSVYGETDGRPFIEVALTSPNVAGINMNRTDGWGPLGEAIAAGVVGEKTLFYADGPGLNDSPRVTDAFLNENALSHMIPASRRVKARPD